MTQFNIKFIGLNRLFDDHRKEYLEATEEVLNSGIAVGGPHIAAFEKNLTQITKRKYAVSVASCTDALFFILTACGIGKGDEVITTSYSFIATASAILRTGATPVFADIDDHYHLNLEEVRKKKTDRTKAVLAVNLLGDCVDFPAFEEYCRKEDLLLIEDAAQSFGARHGSVPSGKLGIASALSFSPMKTVPCFGIAGAIVTDDEDVFNVCGSLRRHGKVNESPQSVMLGYNSVLPTDKAAQLNITIKYMDKLQEKRSEIADKYITGLARTGDIVTPLTREGTVHCWHKFMIRTSRRDELRKHLSDKGIQTQVHYTVPLPSEPIFGDRNPDAYTQANIYSKTCLSLPIYAELKDEEVDYIIEEINAFL
ncbi:MAG: DegT/DnrJ/EryC1/StrS family aminotransferase [Thermodesulfovibrionia bacterium]|nr:DegT/DnrJ/EryC1/StrS family aminotransferase [Thermodesulfovibrionia bacterium]